MDDVRVGRFVRAVRVRLGWRQADLAGKASVSQQQVSLIERGHLQGVPLRTLRRVLSALEASADLDVRWRGGAVDRLLDARHSGLVAGAVEVLEPDDWQTRVEVTYSTYGERGSIDLVGWRGDEGALVVAEVKSELTSVEQTLRKHDEKMRLAPRLLREREGWNVRVLGRILVLPETRTARRQLDRALPLFASTYPLRQREVRAWLKRPVAPVGGVLFVPDTSPRSPSQRIVRSRSACDPGSGASRGPSSSATKGGRK